MPSVVQAAVTSYGHPSSGAVFLTISSAELWSAPTAGNIIVLAVASEANAGVTWPAGFTERLAPANFYGPTVATKIADGSETTLTVTFTGHRFVEMVALELTDATYVSITDTTFGVDATPPLPSITPPAGVPTLLIAGMSWQDAYNITSHPPSYTYIDGAVGNASTNSSALVVWQRTIPSPSGSYGGDAAHAAAVNGGSWQMVFTAGAAAPIADFSAAPAIPDVGDTVTFRDLSGNSPTSWAWTFGDGGTSTSQNPTHAYADPGTYTVSLTATNAFGSDTETKTAYITVLVGGTPDPAPPAGVLLEIYAAAPGAARWDVAKWDEAVWSAAGWRDVTPYGIHVVITWGSNRPELGILSTPEAASWTVTYHDPARILDPSNADGPYFGDLRPFLPIRVSHRGTIVRVGYVTGLSHNFLHPDRGYMRGTDNMSRLANAKVPPDTELADTLYARATDAIAAAGLAVTVAAPIGTDPAVTPWVTGAHEWSAWQWIADAAQETLRIPIIDRHGTLTFRAWASPLVRARSLASPELVDLAAVSDYSGLFSVVQAREDEDTIIERRLTPPPRYGARTYTRNEITLDPDLWAEAVLADRALPGLLWKPGQVRPLTALSTEQLATIEAIERIGLSLPEQTPPVIAAGIVVGGEIDIVGRADDEAVWRFQFDLAQTATEPLIETGGAPTDYLLATGGGEFLYPTGGA